MSRASGVTGVTSSRVLHLLAATVLAAACVDLTPPEVLKQWRIGGTGGITETGGETGTGPSGGGGATGVGRGGAIGSGGSTSAGGIGAGGAVGVGGTTGQTSDAAVPDAAGGASGANGGAGAAGGRGGTGGVVGTGGTVDMDAPLATGGISGTGGGGDDTPAGTGGATGVGGASTEIPTDTGGRVGTGGAGTGGGTGTGGRSGTGGAGTGGAGTGGAGTGGVVGTGGAGTGGAVGTGGSSAGLNCASPTALTNGMVTNFSDWSSGTAKWGTSPGMTGTVFSYASTDPAATMSNKVEGSPIGLHLTGTVPNAGWAGGGLAFLACTNVGSYTQILFDVYGRAQNCNLELQIQTYDQRPNDQTPPGGCVKAGDGSGCFDFPRKSQVTDVSSSSISASPPRTVTTSLSDLTTSNSGGWGAAKAAQIVGVQWQLTNGSGSSCSVGLTLTNIRFK
jgi:hypothetical protein